VHVRNCKNSEEWTEKRQNFNSRAFIYRISANFTGGFLGFVTHQQVSTHCQPIRIDIIHEVRQNKTAGAEIPTNVFDARKKIGAINRK
jgi:hypothetical protein